MKLQVMPVVTSTEAVSVGDRGRKDLSPEILVKAEPADFSDTPASTEPDAQGSKRSHHRKLMMEKWNVQHGDFERKHLSPRNHDNAEPPPPARASPGTPVKLRHNIPQDPRKWTAEHVCRWLEALEMKYALTVDKSEFRMNGRALGLMKLEGFLSRVPGKGGILYEDFRTRLRRYFAACRRRVRTIVLGPGMSLPGKVTHQLPTMRPQSEHPHMQHMVHPSLPPSLIRPPSTSLGTVGGAVGSATGGARAVAPPQQNGPAHLHGTLPPQAMPHHAPSSAGANPPTLPYPSHQLPWQQLPSGTSAGFTGTPTVGAVPHSVGVNSKVLPDSRNLYPLYLPFQGMYPYGQVPSVHAAVSHEVNSTHANRNTQDPFRHPSPLRVPPPSAPPSQSNASAASTKSSTIPTSCPPLGVAQTSVAELRGGDFQPTPFPYYPRPPHLPSSSYYRFVPLYRSMKVFGHFQPITYEYRLPTSHASSLPETTTAFAQQREQLNSSRSSSPTQGTGNDRISSQPVPDRDEQSQALDLSLSRKNARNGSLSSSSGVDVASHGGSERKRFKTEPISP